MNPAAAIYQKGRLHSLKQMNFSTFITKQDPFWRRFFWTAFSIEVTALSRAGWLQHYHDVVVGWFRGVLHLLTIQVLNLRGDSFDTSNARRESYRYGGA